MFSTRNLLFTGGCLSCAVALLHLWLAVSPSSSAFYGAPAWLVAHPMYLFFACLFIAAVFALFGAYAFSGAGVIVTKKLPYLKAALAIISFIYLLRGIAFIGELDALTTEGVRSGVTKQEFLSSITSMIIAMFYITGTASYMREDDSGRF